MLRGEQHRIGTPGKNEKFYLAGALDVSTGLLRTTGTARKTAALLCNLLKLLANSYGAQVRRIHLIVDNYAIRSARAILRTLEELRHRIVLHFLPPCCPDANRIERVWQDLHAVGSRTSKLVVSSPILEIRSTPSSESATFDRHREESSPDTSVGIA